MYGKIMRAATDLNFNFFLCQIFCFLTNALFGVCLLFCFIDHNPFLWYVFCSLLQNWMNDGWVICCFSWEYLSEGRKKLHLRVPLLCVLFCKFTWFVLSNIVGSTFVWQLIWNTGGNLNLVCGRVFINV